MSQALEKARLFKEEKNKANLLRAFLNQMPMGLVILDMDFQMLFQNRKARYVYSFLKKKHINYQYLAAEQKPLPAIVYQNCLALKNQMTSNHLKRITLSTTFSIPLTSRLKYDVCIEVLCGHETSTANPTFLISIDENMLKNKSINEEELRVQFGLTAREIEIISDLFKGFRNSEIADLLKIRCGTVKNHLKNIFNKMGVKTRTSLIYEALTASNAN